MLFFSLGDLFSTVQSIIGDKIPQQIEQIRACPDNICPEIYLYLLGWVRQGSHLYSILGYHVQVGVGIGDEKGDIADITHETEKHFQEATRALLSLQGGVGGVEVLGEGPGTTESE